MKNTFNKVTAVFILTLTAQAAGATASTSTALSMPTIPQQPPQETLSAPLAADVKSPRVYSPWSVGLRAGTLGFGAEVHYKANETFGVRVYGSSFLHERETFVINKTKYKNARLKLLSGGIIADWHFLKNGFRVSGGAVLNGNRINLSRDLSKLPKVTIEGVTLPGAAIGRVASTYKYHKIAGYAGIGYDSPKFGNTSLSFTADVGVLFQGKAKAHVKSTGPASVSPVFQTKLKRYAHKLVNDYQASHTYPVISIGLRYTF